MRISFDLDDTLIPGSSYNFQTKRRNWFQKITSIEKIRKGTKELFKFLQKREHEVGIYTTSFRSKFKIWFQFLSYRIKPSFIINEKLNRIELKKRNISSSKYPPVFAIYIHVDDSKGIGIEGDRLGFKTIVVDNNAENWVEEIKKNL